MKRDPNLENKQTHWQVRHGKAQVLELKLRQWRAAAFLFATALSIAASINGSAKVVAWLAGFGWALFIAAVIVHQVLRRRMKRLEQRIKLQSQLDRLQRLERQVEAPPEEKGFSQAAYRLIRDFDLVDGFLRLFPFFITLSGRRRFLELMIEPAGRVEEIHRRQKAVRFWEERTVLRRKALRMAAALEQSLDGEVLLTNARFVAAPENGFAYFWMVAGAQILFFVLWAIAISVGVKVIGTIGLVLWLGSYFIAGRKVELMAGYPKAVVLGSQLRVLREASLVFDRVAGHADAQVQAFAGERNPLVLLKDVERAAGALGIRQNPILALLINFVFPWDLFWTLRFDRARRKILDGLEGWLACLAEVESFLILAEWNRAHGDSWPAIDGGAPGLEATALAHPLLPANKRVANDIQLKTGEQTREQVRCHLVTGSNMAGKSTFLRAIGMNVLLANAGAKVCAKTMRLSHLRVESSMRPADSLADGFSSFYAEVTDLVEIVKLADSNPRPAPLYLVDEIFRGTNNRERRIGAEAVIRSLAKTSAIGLVTTHDLDLATLEGGVEGLRNHHFRDDVADGKMTFTYEYRTGPCPSTNAIKVMRGAGLRVSEA